MLRLKAGGKFAHKKVLPKTNARQRCRSKKAIEEVIGGNRKGRMKVIKRAQKKHPEMGDSKIRRVYETEVFR